RTPLQNRNTSKLSYKPFFSSAPFADPGCNAARPVLSRGDSMSMMADSHHAHTEPSPMNTNRRDFVKGCTAASACALVLPGIAVAAPGPQANHAAASGATIEKSIKAGFGGGFSL